MPVRFWAERQAIVRVIVRIRRPRVRRLRMLLHQLHHHRDRLVQLRILAEPVLLLDIGSAYGRTSDLGDEVMQPPSFDPSGVPRNPQSVRLACSSAGQ